MADLAVIAVAAMLPVLVCGDLGRRAARARSVRRDVDEYLSWMLDDIR